MRWRLARLLGGAPATTVEEIRAAAGSCFLCGESNTSILTKEHVFPKWLLKRHNLWCQQITLLNGTSLPYRSITVPCCAQCNNEHLNGIETLVRSILEDGVKMPMQLKRMPLLQWLAKIAYGILIRESTPLLDRRTPENGSIAPPWLLQQFDWLRFLLQSIRTPTELAGFNPWSLIMIETHSYSDWRDFDYFDGLSTIILDQEPVFSPSVALRTNGLGIVAAFSDLGDAESRLGPFLTRADGAKFHPFQFEEIATRVMYAASLFQPHPWSIKSERDRYSGRRRLKVQRRFSRRQLGTSIPWHGKQYAAWLLRCWGRHMLTMDDVYKEPGHVRTFLINPDGSPIVMQRDDVFVRVGDMCGIGRRPEDAQSTVPEHAPAGHADQASTKCSEDGLE